MGYSTDFKLDVSQENSNAICPTCGHTGSFDFKNIIIKEVGYDPFEESCRWYEWEEVMRKISFRFPDVLFTIYGEGEENGDIWTAYFQGGKMQLEQAIIQTLPFDPSKLE